MTKQIFSNDWQEILGEEFGKSYYRELREFLKEEYANETIYPVKENIWNAFEHTAYEDVKAVILGQDPYHGPNQAHGLSFSVQPGIAHPPSLRNIFKELEDDIGCEKPVDGTLTKWSDQGVLMLNTVLTVRQGQAHSHQKKGWEQFTDEVIRKLSEREAPVIFILWGKPAQMKKRLIDTERHDIIEAPHPSPLSAHRGFFGSKPFSKVNKLLQSRGEEPIDFCLD
ncbi:MULTISPECIES: uracil-DNA glycosylase [unclassified Planococcus (in: firmicutes)]|uniref:uracil-DNA glycosylase n=1 Tax=unclassified Planococcus (in: firmicutes) TaxID=2662419 RepID=UPI000C328C9B|nr:MULTISPECIES: uracil-DNA glycosylase [unclassified Planococcus (in: firmicutes)]AUD14656.1 uracil-DNA glycosylase [Planococcus sp. MB-3u-03]PKG44960.1 uracil-DNA glycosylase [Planococcus sp. Urea-trap-24]PKG87303.1 uracil-DNA glycosylase [Planococcus sp. Urea-3u-39]PKH42428.1 uracil-DNA glycosylase [Planococcus sp. MB-3u-09]